jgi:hypothetical protein
MLNAERLLFFYFGEVVSIYHIGAHVKHAQLFVEDCSNLNNPWLHIIMYSCWLCSLMVGWFDGTLSIRVQILVLAPFHANPYGAPMVTSGSPDLLVAQSFGGAHRGRICVCVS